MPPAKSVVLTSSLIDQGGFETPAFGDASSEISGSNRALTTIASSASRGLNARARTRTASGGLLAKNLAKRRLAVPIVGSGGRGEGGAGRAEGHGTLVAA